MSQTSVLRQSVPNPVKLVDIAARPGTLDNYLMVPKASTGNISGFFVDSAGNRVGSTWTYAFGDTTTVVSLTTMYTAWAGGSTLPTGAEGLIFDLDVDLLVDIYDAVDATQPASTLESDRIGFTMEAGNGKAIGRVA